MLLTMFVLIEDVICPTLKKLLLPVPPSFLPAIDPAQDAESSKSRWRQDSLSTLQTYDITIIVLKNYNA